MKPIEIIGIFVVICMIVMFATFLFDDAMSITEINSSTYNTSSTMLGDFEAASGLLTPMVYVVMGIVLISFVVLIVKTKIPKI